MSSLSELQPSGGGGTVIEKTASGALSNGDLVIVNSDGTVSAATGSTNTISQTGSQGSGTVANPCNEKVDVCYHSGQDKVIAVWRDCNNGCRGVAQVGTVSGTSISWGSVVEFNNSYTREVDVCYDSNADKIVVVYRDDGNGSGYGTAIVGTVSGTSITFGTEVRYISNTTYDNQVEFDTETNNVIVTYVQANSSGGPLYAIAGTVSGTSISFGSAVSVASSVSGEAWYMKPISGGRFFVVYNDSNNSSYVTSRIGTLSGTTISMGTSAVVLSQADYLRGMSIEGSTDKALITEQANFQYVDVSGSTYSFLSYGAHSIGQYLDTIYDTYAQCFMGVYQDNSNNYAKALKITSNGTHLTFDTPVTINSNSSYYPANAWGYALTYDTTSYKTIVLWHAQSSDYLMYGVVYPTFSRTEEETNLTTENYIGIADADYSDAATAVIQSFGSVDDAQTGLTAGQAYYIQTDGTLSTTPDDPEVFAGTAVSSTQLIIGG